MTESAGHPFWPLVRTVVLIIVAIWSCLVLLGYGFGMALLLSWMLSGLLLPLLVYLRGALWPIVMTRFQERPLQPKKATVQNRK